MVLKNVSLTPGESSAIPVLPITAGSTKLLGQLERRKVIGK